MGDTRNIGLKLGIAGAALYILISSLSAAYGLEGDGGTTPVPGVSVNGLGNSGVAAQIPTDISTGGFSNMLSGFTSCGMGQGLVGQLRTVVDLATGEKKASDFMGPQANTAAMNANCPELPLPDVDSMSCSQFKSKKTKVFDPQALKRLSDQIDKVVSATECKQKKVQAILSEISCMETQAGALKAQIQSLDNIFDKNFQSWQKDMLTIDTALNDRKEQDKFVLERLNGSGTARKDGMSNGREGLLAMKTKLQDAMNKLNGGGGGGGSGAAPAVAGGDLLDLQSRARLITQARATFEIQKQNRTVTLMNQCFSGFKTAGYKCSPNGPVVTPREYIECRYRQNLLLGSGKEVNYANDIQAHAAARASELDAVLGKVDQFSGQFNASTTGDAQKDQTADAQTMTATSTIHSFDDLKSEIEGQLASFQDSGLDIKGEVLRTYQNCYGWGQKVMTSEVTQKTGKLGAILTGIDQQDRLANAQASALIGDNAKIYDSAFTALTGQHAPIDPSTCNAGSLDRKVGCLQELSTKLGEIYNGRPDGQGTLMNINVPAQDSHLAFTVNCNGVLGCVNTLQNAEDGLKREVTRIDNFKKNYAQTAKTNLENFTSSMAKMLSPQSQQIKSMLQQLSGAARSLGIDVGKVDDIQGEKIKTPKPGELPEKPDDILALISGKMNPHFPDLDSDGFASARSGAAGKVSELAGELVKDKQAQQALQDKKTQCIDEDVEKTKSLADSAVSTCYGEELCKAVAVKDIPLSSIGDNLTGMFAGMPDFADVITSLSTGKDRCGQINDLASDDSDAPKVQSLADIEKDVRATGLTDAKAIEAKVSDTSLKQKTALDEYNRKHHKDGLSAHIGALNSGGSCKAQSEQLKKYSEAVLNNEKGESDIGNGK